MTLQVASNLLMKCVEQKIKEKRKKRKKKRQKLKLWKKVLLNDQIKSEGLLGLKGREKTINNIGREKEKI